MTPPNPLAAPQPRTYAERMKDIVAERVIIDTRAGTIEIYGHRLDHAPAWIMVSGLDRAAVEIDR